MKMSTRMISILFCVIMLAAVLTISAFAAGGYEIIDSGYCGGEGDGTNLSWTFDSNGTLTISGTGRMADYLNSKTPWVDCASARCSLVLNEGITHIGEGAFEYRFTGKLIIPKSVTSIGCYAFKGCTGFTSLTIPNGVVEIGQSAFEDCSGFTGDLIIPASVAKMEYRAFKSCTGFTGLIISDGVAEIGQSAFEGCSGFTGDLIIPDSVAEIGFYAFKGCTGFTGDLIIPDSVAKIGFYAFKGCTGFTSLTILNGVVEIGQSAFED